MKLIEIRFFIEFLVFSAIGVIAHISPNGITNGLIFYTGFRIINEINKLKDQ